jgi:hypothetical protein
MSDVCSRLPETTQIQPRHCNKTLQHADHPVSLSATSDEPDKTLGGRTETSLNARVLHQSDAQEWRSALLDYTHFGTRLLRANRNSVGGRPGHRW